MIRCRWTMCPQVLINRPVKEHMVDIIPAEEDLPISFVVWRNHRGNQEVTTISRGIAGYPCRGDGCNTGSINRSPTSYIWKINLKGRGNSIRLERCLNCQTTPRMKLSQWVQRLQRNLNTRQSTAYDNSRLNNYNRMQVAGDHQTRFRLDPTR